MAWRVLLVELAEDGSIGGSHRCLVDIARHLDRREFVPVIVFHEANPYVDELREEGFEVHLLESRWVPASRVPSRLKRLALKRAVVRKRLAFLDAVSADLVHLNNSPRAGWDDWLPAARIRGIPCLSHARGFPTSHPHAVVAWASRKFDRVITISWAVHQAWLKAGIPPSRLTQIYDGVDLESLKAKLGRTPAEVRTGFTLAPDCVLVTMVGHLRTWKGQDVLLQALEQLVRQGFDRLHVALIGGPTNSEDNTYIEGLHHFTRTHDLGSRVTFLGPRRDAADFMNAADIVVHASTSPEPFGLVVVEGLALGKPVVASRFGGPGEVIRPGAGLLFDPSRPSELAGHLRTLAQDPALRHRLGEAGRAGASQFDITVNVAVIQALYRKVLTGSRRPRLAGATG